VVCARLSSGRICGIGLCTTPNAGYIPVAAPPRIGKKACVPKYPRLLRPKTPGV